MAILAPGDKQDCFVLMDFFALNKNGQAFYPGPVTPPIIDGTPLWTKNWQLKAESKKTKN